MKIISFLQHSVLNSTTYKDLAREYLKQYLDKFGSKLFMVFEVQRLFQSARDNAYFQEQELLEKCEQVHASKIPPDSIIINIYMLYKIKVLQKDSLYCKVRITSQ